MTSRLWACVINHKLKIALAGIGFIAGILFWGAFNTGMEATNTLSFCISCHEMKDTVYQEYKTSVHYTNRSGVRAICSDCHVPHPWFYKIKRKIQASNEVYHKIMGTVDTPEKFEAHRLELAQHVWSAMKSSDSRECRNCHKFEAMAQDKQKPRAWGQHSEAMKVNPPGQDWFSEIVGARPETKDGATCIDCHKGIAHHKPVDPQEQQAAPASFDLQ